MADRWSEFDEEFRAKACKRDAHDDCPHFVALGGGFNPRRLRPEFGLGLCRCPCHSGCPVTITTKRLTVPPRAWHSSCTCPGADRQRQRWERDGTEVPDFGEWVDEARRRSRERREAVNATRARAGGKSREEIREIYLSELLSRGLPVPHESIVDAVVAHIAGNPIPAARVAGQAVFRLGKELHDIAKIFRQSAG